VRGDHNHFQFATLRSSGYIRGVGCLTRQNMKTVIIFVVIFAIIWLVTRPLERARKRRLNRFWSRTCTGLEWRVRFPDASKDDIRSFLTAFVDGFAFSDKQRLKFSPDDKVMDVYRALYPSAGGCDALELETFAMNLEEKYGIDLSRVEDHEVTLGTLFQMTGNLHCTPDSTFQAADELPKPVV
jgi:hypothetical protein